MKLFKRLKAALEKAGYSLTIKASTGKIVSNAFFRFNGLPREIGWSEVPRIALSIKIEIDLNPPKGADIDTTLIQRFFPIAVRHYDLASLFAGKLHALAARPYAKGRDWFDLVWYLTERKDLQPNLALLQNALIQTGHMEISAAKWRDEIRRRLRSLNWEEIVADLRPFLERQSDLDHLVADLLHQLLLPPTTASEEQATPIPTESAQALVEPLTARELDVLKLLCEGLTNREIADELILAIGTVKFYTGQIYGKLGVRNRVTAVARARELDLIANE